ncbi:MAG: DUF615 domain-containing protein [Gammaproteobacteria bacterium]|nr:DUF615 domain-containing protein [Gammaproteobacteria bacterium]
MKKNRHDKKEDAIDEDDIISRSEIKRDLKALQDLAKELIELKDQQLAKLPLNDIVLAAIVESRRITQHIARKRHLKYVTKQLRELDEEALRHGMSVLKDQDNVANARFHHMEKWRDRLIEGGDDVLKALLDEYPHAERQQLRQLIRNAQREKLANQPPKSARALFKLIRELME